MHAGIPGVPTGGGSGGVRCSLGLVERSGGLDAGTEVGGGGGLLFLEKQTRHHTGATGHTSSSQLRRREGKLTRESVDELNLIDPLNNPEKS